MDLIDRQAVIDVLGVGKEVLSRVLDDTDVVWREREKYLWGLGLIEAYINDMKELPSVQPEEIALHESCTDCPLYDKDRHRCPRFNKVIPETLRELQSAQPEPCEDAVSRRRLLSDLKELTAAWGKYPVMAEQIKGVEAAIGYVETISSAQPEQHEIGYSECANAMLKMWIDNVLTDGEYNRIMDKLNAHWAERREENE